MGKESSHATVPEVAESDMTDQLNWPDLNNIDI